MALPGYTDPYADEAAEIERRRRYAEAMREQSGQQIQPYSVGGMQAPISWTQGAAKLLQGYNAGAAGRDAEQRAKALRERVQGDRTSDMSALANALRGSPGGMQADAADNVTQMPARPAGQLDPSIMGQLKSPDMQNMAMQMFMKQMQPKPNVNVPAGGVVYDPNTKRPEFTAPFKPDKPAEQPSAIREYEYAKGQGFKGTFHDFQIAQKKAGATRLNVDARTGGSLAGQVGPMMKESTAIAEGAVKQVDAAQRIVAAVDAGKIITGPTADARLLALQVASVLGVGGKDDAEKIANTRTALRGLAELTLQGRQQMKGQGAITESEGKLAEKAMSAEISLTAPEIRQLAKASERAARFNYTEHQRKLKVMQGDKELQNLAPFYQGPAMPAESGAAPVKISDKTKEFLRSQGIEVP